MSDQTNAETIIDQLYEMQHVDCYDLAVYAFDQLSDKDRTKFSEMIKENYELYTMDEARDSFQSEERDEP